MAMTYILVDASKRATVIPASQIEAEATQRMVRGEKFEIYRAEPMKLEINLSPAAGPTHIGGGGRRRKATATRRKAVRRRGAGRVGRPKVNVGPCTVPGCKNTSKTRGLCSAHYQQHRRLVRQGKAGLVGASGARAAKTTRKRAGKKRAAKRRGAKKSAKKTARKTSRRRTKKAGRKRGSTRRAATASPSAG